jgi:hypothetical protein
MGRKILFVFTVVLVWLLLLGSGTASPRRRHTSPTRQNWHYLNGRSDSPAPSPGKGSNRKKHRKSSSQTKAEAQSRDRRERSASKP